MEVNIGEVVDSKDFIDLRELQAILKTEKGWMGRWIFNVGLELRKWAIADVLGLIPEDDPEICHRNFDLPEKWWS